MPGWYLLRSHRSNVRSYLCHLSFRLVLPDGRGSANAMHSRHIFYGHRCDKFFDMPVVPARFILHRRKCNLELSLWLILPCRSVDSHCLLAWNLVYSDKSVFSQYLCHLHSRKLLYRRGFNNIVSSWHVRYNHGRKL